MTNESPSTETSSAAHVPPFNSVPSLKLADAASGAEPPLADRSYDRRLTPRITHDETHDDEVARRNDFDFSFAFTSARGRRCLDDMSMLPDEMRAAATTRANRLALTDPPHFRHVGDQPLIDDDEADDDTLASMLETIAAYRSLRRLRNASHSALSTIVQARSASVSRCMNALSALGHSLRVL